MHSLTALPVVSELPVPPEGALFLRTLLRHPAGTLQKVVGVEEAAGFIRVLGQETGEEINQGCREALGVSRLTRERVADVLVDLGRRTQGDFHVIEQDDEKFVQGDRAGPSAEKVIDRPPCV
jgi:hypothetical protein